MATARKSATAKKQPTASKRPPAKKKARTTTPRRKAQGTQGVQGEESDDPRLTTPLGELTLQDLINLQLLGTETSKGPDLIVYVKLHEDDINAIVQKLMDALQPPES